MSSKLPDARETALVILNRLSSDGLTADAVLEKELDACPHLSQRDRNFCYMLVFGVLRWRGRLDWVIDRFSTKGIKKMQPKLLNILRLGLFQLIHTDRVPVSAAVNTSVNLAKKNVGKWSAGFVNALLRNADRQKEDITFPTIKADPVKAVSVTESFPFWLVKRWIRRFGIEETRLLCRAMNQLPPLTLRTNTLKISRNDLILFLEEKAAAAEHTPFSPSGIYIKKLSQPMTELETFKKGHFQVQDEAAQLIGLFVNPRPGQRVLDACSGLGGKTGHLAQLMDNRGSITAVDHHQKRLRSLQSEMKRLGISIVSSKKYDLNIPPAEKEWGQFDRILLDAPCSGLGVLRRHPDGKWAEGKSDLIRYRDRQILFLNCLAPLVKDSGRLIYSVCTFEPEETDEVIERFLHQNPEFTIVQKPEGLTDKVLDLLTPEGYLRTLPHQTDMDGFFAVCLEKKRFTRSA